MRHTRWKLFWHGRVGCCVWYYLHKESSQEEFDTYLRVAREDFAAVQEGAVALTIPFGVDPPTAAQRKDLAELLTDKNAARIHHHAFVTDSAVAYGVNTAINWLSKKPWIEKCFRKPTAGLAWLHAKTEGRLDIVEVQAAIQDTVAPEALWKPFFVRSAGG